VTRSDRNPSAYQGWLRQNNPQHEAGSFGLARRALPGEGRRGGNADGNGKPVKPKAFQGGLTLPGRRSSTRRTSTPQPKFDPIASAQGPQEAINYLFTYTGADYRELQGMDAQSLVNLIG
jgi:hypothetical protein